MKEKIINSQRYNTQKTFRDLYRGINEFKKGYQSRTNLLKDENSHLLADSLNILNVLVYPQNKFRLQILLLQGCGHYGVDACRVCWSFWKAWAPFADN
jgi:hypothetical protein